MAKTKASFCWHVHHNELIEWCYNYDERADYIRPQKPESERELRLRLFQPVRGVLPKAFVKTCAAYGKAYVVHRSEIEALHAVECSDCPWNGHTIFLE